MKLSKAIILIPVLFVFSCSSNKEGLLVEDFSVNEYPQTWKLFKMTGSLAYSETTGEDMAWQEEYRLTSDGRVVKTRTQDGESSSIMGYFSLIQQDEQSYILIEYEEDSDLIGSCTGTEESLYIDSQNKLLQSNWWACDGPGLFYKKK